MARPFLADPEFVMKAQSGRVDEINTCIACNQACLDHTFKGQRASCLVNPRAGYESEFQITQVAPGKKRKIAVVCTYVCLSARLSIYGGHAWQPC